MKRNAMRLLPVAFGLLLLIGCSAEQDVTGPVTSGSDKNGSETLGPPDIELAAGSGIAYGGVGLISQPATLDIDVPGDVVQVLLYWSGGTNIDPYLGDDTIEIDGTEITGDLIGGPSYFFEDIWFTSYRADITGLGLVGSGANSLDVSGLFYDAGAEDLETNGAGLLVVYDDGTGATLALRDGLDLAYFDFPGVRQVTVPQTFDFPAADVARTAELTVLAGSVEEDRPNEIRVTVGGDVQSFVDVLGSSDGPKWDAVGVMVDVPAGADAMTVELISTPGFDPRGASLTWTASSLAVPEVVVEPAALGDYVWEDLNGDGLQDMDEPGVEGVVVHLMDCDGGTLAETMTDADGLYLFDDLAPGDYDVHFVLPAGWMFTTPDVGVDDAVDSDTDMNGFTSCVSLAAGEENLTLDAGIVRIPMEGCTRTIGYWKNHAGFGPQDDMVTPLLPQWLGDDDGDKSLAVTDAATAVDVLEQRTYGRPNNGITKLYAQLLAAKLNMASGADGADIADAVADADAFLADHDWNDWRDLDDDARAMVQDWKDMFDGYNNGYVGPGHCDDDDDDDGPHHMMLRHRLHH